LKGSITDILAIPAVLAALGIAVFLGSTILEQLKGTDLDQQGTITSMAESYKAFDEMFIILLAGLSILALVGAAMINSHPVFFVINVLVLAFLVFLGTVTVGNVFIAFSTSAEMATAAANFPYIALFFTNLPTYMIVEGFLILYILHSKTTGLGGGGAFV
jgi:hypothetical protein